MANTQVKANDIVSLHFTLGSNAPAIDQVIFEFANGTYTREVAAVDASTGVATATITADWPNGQYTLSSIKLVDHSGMKVIYTSDPHFIAADDWYYLHLPQDNRFSYSAIQFTVAGATAAVTLPTITRFARTSPDPLAAGQSITYAVTVQPGTSPHWTVSLTIYTGEYWTSIPVTVSDATQFTFTIPTSKEWQNGAYAVDQLVVSDADGATHYGRDLNSTAVDPSTGFQLTGGANSSVFPLVTSITRTSPDQISPGQSASYTCTLQSGTSAITSVTLNLTRAIPGVSSTEPVPQTQQNSVTISLPITAQTPSLAYSLQSVTVVDAIGRTATYYPNGSSAYGVMGGPPVHVDFGNPNFTVIGGLTVPPLFFPEPQSTYVQPGDYLYLNAAVDSFVHATFQWYQGMFGDTSTPIAGAQNSTSNNSMVLIHAPPSATYYWLRVTTPWGTIDSDMVKVSPLYVASPSYVVAAPNSPYITTQPTAISSMANGSGALKPLVTGPGPLSYQWFKDGTAVPGATNSTLQFAQGQLSDNGSYVLQVSNQWGNASTDARMVQFESPPTITTQPLGQTVAAGGNVTLRVAATGGGLRYRWQRNGTFLPSNTSTLTLTNLSNADAGTYTALINNSLGQATSTGAAITVSPAGSPVLADTSLMFAVVGSPFSDSIAATASPQSFSATGLPPGMSIDNTGKISGTPQNAGTYQVTITAQNSVGTATTNISLNVATPLSGSSAPIVTNPSSPSEQVVAAGSAVTLSATVNGTAPIALQWMHRGIAIPGATASSYTIFDASGPDAGDYELSATNAYGSQSSTFKVTVSYAVTPATQTVAAGDSFYFAVVKSSKAASYQWYVGATGDTSHRENFTGPSYSLYASRSESLWVRISFPDGTSTDAAAGTLTVVPSAIPPSISAQPATTTLKIGDTTALVANATGTGLTYQWEKDGVNIPYATNATLLIENAMPADAGIYQVVISNSAGKVVSSGTNVVVQQLARLTNLSIRSQAGIGDATLIVGFGVSGPGNSTEKLLLRGMGPTLTSFGVNQVLPDPLIALFRGSAPIASNDDWSGASALAMASKAVGAFDFMAPDSKDAALVLSTSPDVYTFTVTAAHGPSGVALAEIYELPQGASGSSTAAPQLTNISARTVAGAGEDVLAAGFNISGSTPAHVLVRGIGPGLLPFGVNGVLSDPQLQIIRDNKVVATSNDWVAGTEMSAAIAASGAFPLKPGSKDAAALVWLSPGLYSVLVSGVDGVPGIALVEVYLVP